MKNKAQSEFDTRTKWMKMKMDRTFITWLMDIRRWEWFVEKYTEVWRDQGGQKGPRTQRQVAEAVWNEHKGALPALPDDVKVFSDIAPPVSEAAIAFGTGEAKRAAKDAVEYEVENSVDFWKDAQWALANNRTAPTDIEVWRSEVARLFHQMLRSDPFKFMAMWEDKIVGTATVDRGGRHDDGSEEVELIRTIAGQGKPEAMA